MQFSEVSHLAKLLTSIDGKVVYVTFEPDVLDFTDSIAPKNLILHTSSQQIKINLSDDSLVTIVSLLKLSVFTKEVKLICWDWKTFASYFHFVAKHALVVESAIVDLKVLESYVNINTKRPENLSSALLRLKNLVTAGYWRDIEHIYRNLHLPLITTVLPAIETTGILDVSRSGYVYGYYEVNGQENGRLRCFNAYNKGFVPHAMGQEVKVNLKPRNQDELFLSFDYRAMEVYILAWLSQDALLLEMCSENDVYGAIFSKITGNNFNGNNDREFAKKFFLPVIYGQSARALSDRLGIAKDVAERIIERIDTTFPTVSTYLLGFQKQVQETGYARDQFGKRRSFEEGKQYMVRNFAVQAPAAVVCLDKLNQLYFALKNITDIAYTVHDGYTVYADKTNYKQICKIAFDVLSGESQFCPDLRLRVTCRAGRNLNDLKSLARRGEKC